jgi:putative Mn2+ efflux pump MntP
VLPAAGGIASIIHGTLHANWRHVRDGVGGLAFGLVAFVVLGYMFEGWLGFEGFGLNRIAAWVPGVILLAVGVIVLFAGTPGERSSRRAEREQRGAERRATPQGWTSAPVVPPEEKKMETITPAEVAKPEDKQPQ